MLGIITIATGHKRYIDMAKMLAISLIRTNPDIKRAVISDATEYEFKGLYDIFIPYDNNYGSGLRQKLYLDKYSPFDETLFIDADCLVVKPLQQMLAICNKHSFVVFGGQINTGEWYMDVAAMCRHFKLPSIPLFNGGTYYFNNKAVAEDIYDKARNLADDYEALGFKKMNGSINEEPLVAVAMALNNVDAVDDKGIGMRTPIGINGPLNIDTFKQECYFDKEGEIVSPAILHFAGSYSIAFHYRRETARLKLIRQLSFVSPSLVSFLVGLYYNIGYSAWVFCKRMVKIIIRGNKINFSNPLPVFSNL
jgi:hypothetical protein